MGSQAHYYGDIVRKLFLSSAIFIIIVLPFMVNYIEVPVYVSILAALFISVFAGITNPLQKWVVIFDFGIAFLGAFIFELAAINGYTTYSLTHRTFWVNQIEAVIFIIALYYSTKTVRGMFLK